MGRSRQADGRGVPRFAVREKGEKGKNILGSIIYTPEKVFTVDQLPLTRKSSTYFVYRAKEGYVLVSEYFPKEKRIDSRLEKLNY